MADLERTIRLIFGADNQVSPIIGAIERDLGEMENFATGLSAPFADLADKILKIDAVLAGLALTLGGLAFAESVKFESAVADLKKQLDDTDPSIESLLSQIKNLALTFGVSSDALVLATADFKQAGFNASDSLLLVEQSLRLVRAGGVDAAEASELIIASLKGFKAPASETAHLLEVLNAGANAYATDVTELGVGMSKLSPIAATMGLSFEDTADILIPVIEVFRSGSEASDALKTGLLSLLKPTGEAADALKSMGVAVEDQSGNLRNGRDIVFDFAAAFVKLEGSQQAQIAATIFGKDQAARLIEAFNGLGNQTVNVADAMTRVASVQEEVNIALAKSQTIIDRTRVAFEELAKTVGAEYKAELVGIIDATGQLAQALDQAVAAGAFDEFLDLLKPKLKAIEDVIRAMAENLPEALEGVDFSNVLDAFDNLGGELGELFRGLFGDIDLRTVEGLQAALQQTADAFAALINVTAGITQQFQPFFAAIGEGIRKFAELDAESQGQFGELLGIAKQIIDFGPKIALALVAIGEAGIEMGRVMDVVFGGVRVVINLVQASFDYLAKGIIDNLLFIAESANTLSFGAIPGLDETVGDLQTLSDAIGQNLNRNLLELEDGWNQASGAITGNNKALSDAEARLKAVADQVKNTADSSKGLADQTEKAAESNASLNQKMLDLASQGLNVVRDESGKLVVTNAGLIDALDDTVKKTGEASDATKGYRKIINEATGEVIGYEQVGGKLATSLGETAKKTDEALKKTEEFALKLEEIASNERIRTLELAIDFKIADLEADTARIEAAFGAIGATIQSTGDVLSGTVAALGEIFDASKWSLSDEQEKIFNSLITQLELENQIRQQAAEDAHSLNEAIIDNLRAKTEALARGDSLITIQADGLEPHIRAFMWEILKEIQIEANTDFQEFLLGFSPA